MAQENHLTIEQLSAYIDGQLSEQEQVECEAHLQRCRECRSMLADLRQTVSLLHELPQPELPRSFELPARTLSVVEGSEHRPIPVATTTRKGRSWQSHLRRSIRVIGAIAAVLGLFIVTSTLLLSLPHGGASTASSGSTESAPAFSSASNLPATPRPPAAQPPSAGTVHSPRGTATSAQNEAPATFDQAAGNNASPTPVPTSQSAAPNGQQPTSQPRTVPAILDVSMPEGRIGVGFILLVLGVLGVIFTRRRVGRSSREN